MARLFVLRVEFSVAPGSFPVGACQKGRLLGGFQELIHA